MLCLQEVNHPHLSELESLQSAMQYIVKQYFVAATVKDLEHNLESYMSELIRMPTEKWPDLVG